MTNSIRCAIYTRKSSDEGLDQAFNSLHAQRELCAAYVASQAAEGWRTLKQSYDDRGFSGASMRRPALRRLMADVAADRVDVVVVYKVDRLTRSLSDFARIIEAFDRAGVSFVSITQAFNTTTSMGRLTLNILLSFAQFEREVTGERIRDKIAASKAKGLWMGGLPPLGYDAPQPNAPRVLVVNESEARVVRSIFRWYLELRTFPALEQRIAGEGIRSKQRVTRTGRSLGGVHLTRGALRHILCNRTYLGVIPHGAASHPGQHVAIIDQQTFDAVQALMRSRREERKARPRKADGLLLVDKVFDAVGLAMKPVFAKRKGRAYSYYVGPAALPGMLDAGDDDAIRRVPTRALDGLVERRLMALVGKSGEMVDRDELRGLIARVEVHAARIHLVVHHQALSAAAGRRGGVEWIRARLNVSDRVIADPINPGRLRIEIPVRLRRGGRTFIVGPNGEGAVPEMKADRRAILRLRTAHRLLREAGFEPDGGVDDLRRARAPVGAAHTDWAFLAPEIQSAILTGRLGGQALQRLNTTESFPLCWADQLSLLEAPPA